MIKPEYCLDPSFETVCSPGCRKTYSHLANLIKEILTAMENENFTEVENLQKKLNDALLEETENLLIEDYYRQEGL